MKEREKIITALECCKDVHQSGRWASGCISCGYSDKHRPDCFLRLADDAVELLKEQEPVKPCVAVDTWICPKCGHALESQSLIDDKENPQVLVHELYSFCPNCGKAVKWE